MDRRPPSWRVRQLLARTGLLAPIKRIYYTVETRLYRARTRAFFSQVCGPGSLVFDVGANLGQRTQVFLDLGARVVSIEPERRCWEHLERRFGRSASVTVINAAVSDAPGQMRLFVDPQTPEISSLDAQWLVSGPDSGKAGRVEAQLVDVVTLAQLVERFGRPDYIKIDVEGLEARVLRGLTTPVARVSFEFHAETLDALVECCQILSALGDYSFNVTLGQSFVLALPEWVTADALVEAVRALPPGRDGVPPWGDVVARLG